MARTVDLAHRSDLAERVAAQFVLDGTDAASLRDLAAEVGASARMLVHHFGTREALVGAALEVARERQLAAAREAIVPGPDAVAVLGSVWAWFCREDTRRYFALFTGVAARERARPVHERRFAARLGSEWRPLFEDVFRADARLAADAPELAQVVIGVLRGFALDLDDGDADAEAAFAVLVELVARRRDG